MGSISRGKVLGQAGGPFLRIGAVKAFADGSLGSRTAYFYEPYLDQPNTRGLLSDEIHPVSLMRERMFKADAAGVQICTHAIGDEAISTILDLYAEVVKAHGPADRRLRIEHAQHIAEKDFEQLRPTTRDRFGAAISRH